MLVIIKCFAEYLLGILSYKVYKNHHNTYLSEPIFSFCIFILIIILLFFRYTNVFVIGLFVPLIISISSGKGAIHAFLSSKFIYFLGLISYSLYLIHPLILIPAKAQFYPMAQSVPYFGIIFNVSYIIVSILIAYVFYSVIEIPMQKKMRQILSC